jgi:hypothetical protein
VIFQRVGGRRAPRSRHSRQNDDFGGGRLGHYA